MKIFNMLKIFQGGINLLHFTSHVIYNIMFNQEQHHSQNKKKPQRISMPIKSHLINLIQKENFTIKRAAAKCGINYSSAKIIHKKFKSNERKQKFAQENLNQINLDIDKTTKVSQVRSLQCSYIDLNFQKQKEVRFPKITIISTLAWDFVKNGMPQDLVRYS